MQYPIVVSTMGTNDIGGNSARIPTTNSANSALIRVNVGEPPMITISFVGSFLCLIGHPVVSL